MGQGFRWSDKKWGKAGVGWGHQGGSGLEMWAGQEGQEGLQQSKKPDEGTRVVEKDKVQGTEGSGGSTGLKLWISRAVLKELYKEGQGWGQTEAAGCLLGMGSWSR